MGDLRKFIEEYKGFGIYSYSDDPEGSYRVDFGAHRSQIVATVEDARKLVDLRWE